MSEEEVVKFGGGIGNIIEFEHFMWRHQIDKLDGGDICYIHTDGRLVPDTVHALRVAVRRSGHVALGDTRIVRASGRRCRAVSAADDVDAATAPTDWCTLT